MWYRDGLNAAEFVDPCRCFKDDVSSGPSSNDAGIGGAISGAGGPDVSAFAPPAIASSPGFAAPSPPTGATFATAPPSVPMIGTSGTFGADTTAISGAGSPTDTGGGVFSTISGGGAGQAFGAGATPFETFGNIGQPSSPTPAAPTGFTSPPAGGGVGAPAVSVPPGVSPSGFNVDPTSAWATQPGQLTPEQLGQTQQFSARQQPPQQAPQAGGGNIFENAIKSFTNNPLAGAGALAAGGGLVSNLLSKKELPAYKQLQDLSSQLGPQAAQLKGYLSNGTLPPGMQASVDQATASAKARIVSNYASRGQSTDPNQNSALAQELSAVDQNAVVSAGQLAVQLFQQGVSETQMNEQIYTALLNADQAQAKQTTDALGSFASALGRLGPAGGSGNAKTYTLTPTT